MSLRKPYQQPLAAGWWLKRTAYLLYMLRESTSILIGLFCIELWLALLSLARGESSWNHFITIIQQPVLLIINSLILIGILWHMWTWFQLTPKTLNLTWRGKPLAASTIKAGHYIATALISLVVITILGGWL